MSEVKSPVEIERALLDNLAKANQSLMSALDRDDTTGVNRAAAVINALLAQRGTV